MKYFSKNKKWIAYVMLLTFLFTCIMPSNLGSMNSMAEAAASTTSGTNGTVAGQIEANNDNWVTPANDNRVQFRKTITAGANENEFDIKLEVKTTQNMQEIPVSDQSAVILVLDTSTSMSVMNSPKLRNMKGAAKDFLTAYSKDASENNKRLVAVIDFNLNAEITKGENNNVWFDLSQTGATEELKGKIDSLDTGNGTNMDAGLKLAQNLINASDQTLAEIDDVHVILLSDGGPNTYASENPKGSTTKITNATTPNDTNPTKDGIKKATSAAKDLKSNNTAKKVTLYTVGFDLDNYNWQWSNDEDLKQYKTIKDWLKFGIATSSLTAFESSKDIAQITNVFKVLSSIITTGAQAWIVTDKMGQYIDYVGLSSKNTLDNKYTYALENKTLTWDLRLSEATETGSGETTTYYYSLVYSIRLDNTGDNFPFAVVGQDTGDIQANEYAELKYFLLEDANNATTEAQVVALLKTLDAVNPEVEGYKGDVTFKKVDADDNSKMLDGATFELRFACSDAVNDHNHNTDDSAKVFKSVVSDKNKDGNVTFSDIPSGHYYKLYETAAPAGYEEIKANDPIGTYYVDFGTVKENNKTGRVISSDNKNNVITNKALTGSIEFKKTDGTNPLNGATFGLYASEEDANANTNVVQTMVSDTSGDTSGKVTFTDVAPGDYYVKEIDADNDGYVTISGTKYKVDTNVYKVTVTAGTTTTTLYKKDGSNWVAKTTPVVNIPVTTVEFTKTDGTNPLAGATFGLYASEANAKANTNAIQIDESGDDGIVTFVDVPYGIYYLKEVDPDQTDDDKFTVGEKTYAVSSNVYTVSVTSEGTVINGAVKDATTQKYEIVNVELVDKTVTKVWSDYDNTYNTRPERITVQLKADNVAYGDPVTLSEPTPVQAFLALFSNSNANEWTYTWEGLPKYKIVDGNAILINYTVEEVAVDGYTSSVTDDGNTNEFVITNTLIEFTFGKTYEGSLNGNNHAVFTATSTTGEEHVVTATENNGSVTFTGLKAGYTYTVEETTVPTGYVKAEEFRLTVNEAGEVTVSEAGDLSGNADDGYTLLNELAEAEYEFTKVYEGNLNETEATFTATNTANAEDVVVASEEGNVYTFAGLTRGQTYTVTESNVPEGYVGAEAFTITVNMDGTIESPLEDATLLNELAEAEYEFTKVYEGNLNETEATFTATNTANAEDVVVASEEGNVYTFAGLTRGQTYTVTESNVPEGYVGAEAFTITVNMDGTIESPLEDATLLNELAEAEYEFTKVYEGNLNETEATFTATNTANAEDVVVASEEGNVYTFAGLTRGQTYTVTETSVPTGYVKAEVFTITVNMNGTVDSPLEDNILLNETIKINIPVSKTWVDDQNKQNTRPGAITVQLLANGNVADSAELTAANGWTHTFENVVEYANGEKIDYTVQEVPVEGYTSSVTAVSTDANGRVDVTAGFVIKNTLAQTTFGISGLKTWVNETGTSDSAITIELYRDGEVYKKVETSKDTNWLYSFTNLPKYAVGEEGNGDGHVFSYMVKEVPVPGYTTSYTKPVVTENGYTVNITNTFHGETISVAGEKTWVVVDGLDENFVYPAITVRLLQDGKPYKAVTLENGETKYEFNNLPKYKYVTDAKTGAVTMVEYEYEIAEDPVSGYVSVVDGYNLKNIMYNDAVGAFTVSKKVIELTEGAAPKDVDYNFELHVLATFEGDPEESNRLFSAQVMAGKTTTSAYQVLLDAISDFENSVMLTTSSQYQYLVGNAEDGEVEAYFAVDRTTPNALVFEVTSPSALTFEANNANSDELKDKRELLLVAVEKLAAKYEGLDNIYVVLEDLYKEAPITTGSALGFGLSELSVLLSATADYNAAVEVYDAAVEAMNDFLHGGRTTPSVITLKINGEAITLNADSEYRNEDGSYTVTFKLKDKESKAFEFIATTGCSLKYKLVEVFEENDPAKVNYKYTNITELFSNKVTPDTELEWTELTTPSQLSYEFGNYYDVDTPPGGGGGYTPPYTPPQDPVDPPKAPEEVIEDPEVPLDEPPVIVPGEEIPEPEVPLGDAPRTGDTNNAVPFMALMLFAMAGLVVTRRRFN